MGSSFGWCILRCHDWSGHHRRRVLHIESLLIFVLALVATLMAFAFFGCAAVVRVVSVRLYVQLTF